MSTTRFDMESRQARSRAQRISQGLQKKPFAADHPEAARDLSEEGKFFETLIELCKSAGDC